jgi:ribosomal protein L37AE/L43A
VAVTEDAVSKWTCFAELFILLAIVIMYLWVYRKNVIYFFKHGRFAPQHQGRACPGCGSDDLFLLKNKSARCNACGAIFASTKQLVPKKEKTA